MKAFAYLRTSSAANVGDGRDSSVRQRLAVMGYAEDHGIEVVGEFYDANVSGCDPIQSRPGFSGLLAAARDLGVGCVLVETASRFARDLVVQETGFAYLRDRGLTLIPVDAPDYFGDRAEPMRVAIRQILGVIAELDKAMTVAKLRGARDRKRAVSGRCEGRKPAPGPAREMAASLRAEGFSLREIGGRLRGAGFFAPSGRDYAASSVAAMLRG